MEESSRCRSTRGNDDKMTTVTWSTEGRVVALRVGGWAPAVRMGIHVIKVFCSFMMGGGGVLEENSNVEGDFVNVC